MQCLQPIISKHFYANITFYTRNLPSTECSTLVVLSLEIHFYLRQCALKHRGNYLTGGGNMNFIAELF